MSGVRKPIINRAAGIATDALRGAAVGAVLGAGAMSLWHVLSLADTPADKMAESVIGPELAADAALSEHLMFLYTFADANTGSFAELVTAITNLMRLERTASLVEEPDARINPAAAAYQSLALKSLTSFIRSVNNWMPQDIELMKLKNPKMLQDADENITRIIGDYYANAIGAYNRRLQRLAHR